MGLGVMLRSAINETRKLSGGRLKNLRGIQMLDFFGRRTLFVGRTYDGLRGNTSLTNKRYDNRNVVKNSNDRRNLLPFRFKVYFIRLTVKTNHTFECNFSALKFYMRC